MKEGIGSAFLLNLIMIFIVLVFAILAITMSYTKAFKVNSMIIDSLEKFEGYNELSKSDISRILTSIGYQAESEFKSLRECPDKTGEVQDNGTSLPYRLCVYHIPVDGYNYRYGVLSYAYIDLPIIGKLVRFPVYSETRDIFDFEAR